MRRGGRSPRCLRRPQRRRRRPCLRRRPSGSFLDDLLAEPMYLLLGAAVVLLGLLGLISLRRRRAARVTYDMDDDDKVAPTFTTSSALMAGGGTRTSPAATPAGAPSPQVADTRVTQPAAWFCAAVIAASSARARDGQRSRFRSLAWTRGAGPSGNAFAGNEPGSRGRRAQGSEHCHSTGSGAVHSRILPRSRDFHAASFACRTGCRARRGFGQFAGNGPASVAINSRPRGFQAAVP